MKRVGIMGGTFDPIHNGHIMLGLCAFEEYGLDEIVYMPSGQPPHKSGRRVSQAVHRAAMVRLAIEPYSQFRFSDIEIIRQGNTYTAQTLILLKELFPDTEYYFIIGADSLFQILNWFHPEDIFKQAVLLTATRNHASERELTGRMEELRKEYSADIRLLHSPNIDISSEELRGRVARNQSIQRYVSPKVEAYIRQHQLYIMGNQEA